MAQLGITDPIADIREGRIPPFNGTKRPRGEGAAPPHSPLVTPRTASSRRGRPRAASAPNPHPHRMYMDGDTSDGMAEDGEEEEEGPGQPNHTVRLGAPPRGAAIPSSSATSSSLRRQAALHRSKGRGSNGHGHGHGHGLGHGSSGGGVGIPASPITGTGTGRTTTTTTTTTTARQAPPVPPRRGTNSVRFAVPPESGGLGRPSTSRFRRRSPASMAASSAGPRVFHSARRRRTQRAWSMDDDALMGRAADEAVPLLPSVPVVELPPSLQDPPQHTVFVQLAGVSEYGDNSSCASYYGVDTSYPHDEAMGAADGALPGLLALQNNGSPTGVTDNFFFGSHAKAQDDGRISRTCCCVVVRRVLACRCCVVRVLTMLCCFVCVLCLLHHSGAPWHGHAALRVGRRLPVCVGQGHERYPVHFSRGTHWQAPTHRVRLVPHPPPRHAPWCGEQGL